MTNKIPDMSAFIGRGFDMERRHIDEPGGLQWLVLPNYRFSDHDVDSGLIVRPRINKPQVLDDYSWLPDGFVWRAHYGYSGQAINDRARTDVWDFEQLADNLGWCRIYWIECIGVESEYAEWGKRHGMEVFES